MKKSICVFVCLVFALASAAFSAPVLLEGFNTASEWTVGGNDISSKGATATVTAETTIKQEGAASAKFTYNYSGNAYYEAYMEKTFSTPLDLSQAMKFTLDIYGDSTASSNLIWYFRFYSTNGSILRYVNWDGVPATGWNTMPFDLIDMEVDPWIGTMDNPAINKISKIQVVFQQASGVSGAGTLTAYIDALYSDTTNDYIGETAIDNFNYADTTALNAAYSLTIPTGYDLDIFTTTALKMEGTAAIQLDYSIIDYWTNVWCMHTYATPIDMSSIEYIRLWVHGDVSIPTMSPLMLFTIEDAAGAQAWGRIAKALVEDSWSCYYIQFKLGPTDGSKGPLYQNKWDVGTTTVDVDLTQIKKLGLVVQGSVQYQSYNFTAVVDNIIQGVRTTGPVPTPTVTPIPPAAARKVWNLY